MTSLPPILLLANKDVRKLMTPADYLQACEEGFRALAEGRADCPAPIAIEGDGGAFHAKGASLRQERYYVALKLNGNFPGNPASNGLPTIQGAILLCDGENGSLLAVIDSIEITLRRTAAATALAARYLARADSAAILICGCGSQAAAQLDALRAVLPLRRGFAWDRDPAKAEALAVSQCSLEFEISAERDLAAAAKASDVIVTCTTAHQPFLGADMVVPGTFVAAVGADSPHKSEIAPELMAKALVVVDSLDQCAAMGDLHHAIEASTMAAADVYADLPHLVTGQKPGRTNDAQVAIFDSTGTAVQDVASAAILYQRALAAGAGHSFELAG